MVYSGSEAASLAALDKAYNTQEPILMYWWTPQWANAKYDLVEVELPAYDDECETIAAEDPDAAVGYDCDYAEDVLYKAFSAELESKDAAAFEFFSNFAVDRGGPERGRPRDPGGDGSRRSRADVDRREPGHRAGVAASRVPRRPANDEEGGPMGPSSSVFERRGIVAGASIVLRS